MKSGCIFALSILAILSLVILALVIFVSIDGMSMEMPSISTTKLRAEARVVEYDNLFRHNEKYINTSIVLTGTIIQVASGSYGKIFRVNTEEDRVVWVNYSGKPRFLEDDYVVIYGIVRGIREYTSVVETTIEVPEINGYVVELINDN